MKFISYRTGASSIKVLLDLGILNVVSEESTSNKARELVLRSSFKLNLLQGMVGNESIMDLNDAQTVADVEFIEKLDTYAIERWEVGRLESSHLCHTSYC